MTASRTAKPPMSTARKATLAAGLFYIGTFIFSIPALPLYDHVVNHTTQFVHGSGSTTAVLWAGLIEVLTGLTGIGTAVALYPILKRHGPGRAVGFVASRTLEAATIVTGVVAVLGVVTLRQNFAGASGADAAALTTSAHALVAVKDWTFLFGPGVMPAVNALCFATILYRTRQVPRWISTLGLIGAPVLIASTLTTLFGGFEQVSGAALLTALPIATWEFSVGVYMTLKGFRNPTAPAIDVTDEPTLAPVLTHA
jgi:hypothetical protein